MNQLDERTRRALCAGDQPPAGAEERVLAAILGPMGPAGGPDGGGSGAVPEPSSGLALGQTSLAYAAKVVGATLGLTAGGVALLAVTAAGVRNFDAKPASRPTTVAVEPAAAELEPAAAVGISEPTVEPESPAEPIEASEPIEPAKTVDPAPPAVTKPSKASDPGNSVEAELALMQQARGAKDPKSALALLDQHSSEFAKGVFAAEREVMRVEQLCALGRREEAKQLADEFVLAYPDNPLRSRVAPACAN